MTSIMDDMATFGATLDALTATLGNLCPHSTANGSFYDRGGADAWYGRPRDPHCYLGPERYPARTEAQRAAYLKGYADTLARGDREEYDRDFGELYDNDTEEAQL
jgi:hypothetical protein